MPPLKVLISGVGIAGPALAFWLSRAGHHVVVAERSPSLRTGGAQIDLRAQGITVVRLMGLLDTIKMKCVDEAGVAIVDNNGNVLGTVLANRSGKGAQSLTSEYEIMRADLVEVLYDAAVKAGVEHRFGQGVEGFEQDADGVVAHFSDGTTESFDVLIGADGQGSRIRKALLSPAAAEAAYYPLGIHMAYWTLPRTADDSNIRHTCNSPGGRMMMRRTHSPTESQCIFILNSAEPALSSLQRAPLPQQKQFWQHRFQDAGWQAPRFIAGMATTPNFYTHEAAQVRTETWHTGRVALVGDAGYCPSPFSGMGTTVALVGAYVLAGEICRNSMDVPAAFAQYDKVLRPFVDEVQKVKPSLLKLGMPQTAWAIVVLRFLVRVICWLRVPQLIARLSREEKGGWRVPRYEELNVVE